MTLLWGALAGLLSMSLNFAQRACDYQPQITGNARTTLQAVTSSTGSPSAVPHAVLTPHFTPRRRSCRRMELHSLLISSSRPSTSARRRRSCTRRVHEDEHKR